MRSIKTDNLIIVLSRPMIPTAIRKDLTQMAANQVVLYFDRQEDALHFTLAASPMMSADGVVNSSAGVKAVKEILEANRITAEGVLNVP